MRKLFLILVLILLNSVAFASDIYRLNNGQTVIIEEVHTNPIVTIDTWVKTGSINEDDKNNGISHFLEHLFFRGSKNFSAGEFDKIVESKGAITNAGTSKDFTHYYITIPSENFDLALKMHSDMLQNPLFRQEELDKERKVVIEEISKDVNSPETKLYDNLIKMIYTNHPYKRKVIGTSEIIENVSRNEIENYFKKYYAPSNMVTVVVGDVNKQDVIKKISDNFDKNFRQTPCKNYLKDKPLFSYQEHVDYMQTQTGYMLVGYNGVKITDKDSFALDVLSKILGEGKTSILYNDLLINHQYAFNVDSANSTMRDDGLFYIMVNFIPDNIEYVKESIFSNIEKIQKYGVTEEQVNSAKNIIENDTFYSRESNSNIAQEIGYNFALTGSTDLYDNYLNKIKTVTVQDVNRVANKYLNRNKVAVSIILPESEKQVAEKVVSNKVTNKLVSKNGNIEKYKFSNGGTLLYTDNKANDIIAIQILFKGGEFLEKIAGTGDLTARMLLEGTKKYSIEELAKIMTNNGIDMSFSSNSDNFVINIMTPKSKCELALNLLDEIINNSSLNDVKLNNIKVKMSSDIKKKRDMALYKALEEHNTNMYFGTVYSNSTKIVETQIPKINLNDIEEFYQKIINPKNMIISVVGNIDEEKVILKFAQIFNSNENPEFNFSEYKIPSLQKPIISQIIDNTTETDWIFLGWQNEGIKNQKDYAALSLINTIMGTGMSSRLFKNLRDAKGLAYQLGSSYNPKMLKGSFVVYIGTNPKNLQQAKNGLFAEINKLKTELIGDDELQNAKEKFLGHYVISKETNFDKASEIAYNEFVGYGYDFDMKNIINQVTAQDIQRVANKYFNDKYVLTIVKK